MMHFREPRIDGDLISELRDVGLLTPDILERIDLLLGSPESGCLDDFLLAGAGFISAPDWISWLIRRHGCHRYGPVRWDPTAPAGVGSLWLTNPNVPYAISPQGAVLVAVLRPDRREGLTELLGSSDLLWAAATLTECAEVRSARSRGAEPPAMFGPGPQK